VGLSEQFSNVTHWPLSRRVVLLGSAGAVATTLASTVHNWVHWDGPNRITDLSHLDRYLVVWVAAQVIVTALCVPAARASREGRIPAYIFVGVQAFFIAGLLQLFGTMSTPLVAIFPAMVIFWALYLDERIGIMGLISVAFWAIVAHMLESYGALPYAPLMVQRSIDAQSSHAWFGSFLFNIVLLTGFCMFLSVLFLNARREQDAKLREAHSALEEANRLIRRYVPTQLAEQIYSGQYRSAVAPERRKLTIVFSDIEGFTSASEEMEAEDLATALNEYLAQMTEIADRYGATVNQLLGDGIMIFFGAPTATNDRDHALRAVRMSVEMQKSMPTLQKIWRDRGIARPFRSRIGINTGFASVGDFGSEGRKLYSGIGVQTNLAARIQAQCEPEQILLSHSTWLLVQDEVACEPRGEVIAKGLNGPIRVYTVCLDSA
jgi:class 3 adenylate cyclase